MNTHQQPSSKEWKKDFWQIVDTYGGGSHIDLPLKLQTFISTLLTSHSEAIRERVLDKKNNFCDCSTDDTCWDCAQYKMACDDILALLNDSDYGK